MDWWIGRGLALFLKDDPDLVMYWHIGSGLALDW